MYFTNNESYSTQPSWTRPISQNNTPDYDALRILCFERALKAGLSHEKALKISSTYVRLRSKQHCKMQLTQQEQDWLAGCDELFYESTNTAPQATPQAASKTPTYEQTFDMWFQRAVERGYAEGEAKEIASRVVEICKTQDKKEPVSEKDIRFYLRVEEALFG